MRWITQKGYYIHDGILTIYRGTYRITPREDGSEVHFLEPGTLHTITVADERFDDGKVFSWEEVRDILNRMNNGHFLEGVA